MIYVLVTTIGGQLSVAQLNASDEPAALLEAADIHTRAEVDASYVLSIETGRKVAFIDTPTAALAEAARAREQAQAQAQAERARNAAGAVDEAKARAAFETAELEARRRELEEQIEARDAKRAEVAALELEAAREARP